MSRISWPFREPVAHRGHIGGGQAVPVGEPVRHPVQLSARVGKVPVGQARVEVLGQGDQLGDGLPAEGGRGVHVVSGLDPAGSSKPLNQSLSG